MVEYTPPPSDLSKLNPIQRYLQKGELDLQDWMRLIALVLGYFIARPYIMKAAKWFFAPAEGERQQKEYEQRRAKAKIGANAIRGSEKQSTIDEQEDQENDTAMTSGSKLDSKTAVVNRKSKPQSDLNKSEEEKLLDWDDEPERKAAEGDKADVMQWLDKWDE